MKFQLICFTLITFCITNSLSAACDDNSMTTNATCIANTTCEWKAKSTGTCGNTEKNTAGNPCGSQTSAGDCNGGCAWNGEDTCAVGTTLADNTSLCATADTSSNCNGNCTWTPNYECAVKTASPGTNSTSPTGTDTTNPTNNAFRLKISALISLGLITLF